MNAQEATVRTLGSTQLPAPGTWTVDPGHAEVGFWGRHLMFTKVRGRFIGVKATVEVADDPNQSTVEAIIDMSSVDSGDQTRDDHLRSEDFFDVANWPTARFTSIDVSWQEAAGTMTGDLTIRDVTHPLTFDVEFLGAVTDPWGNDRAVFSAITSINREDWGLTWNMALESGGLLVSKEVHLELNVELIRQG